MAEAPLVLIAEALLWEIKVMLTGPRALGSGSETRCNVRGNAHGLLTPWHEVSPTFESRFKRSPTLLRTLQMVSDPEYKARGLVNMILTSRNTASTKQHQWRLSRPSSNTYFYVATEISPVLGVGPEPREIEMLCFSHEIC